MREIKYRIYDPINLRMIESGSTPSMLAGFFRDTAALNTKHGMPYLQNAGLRDVNGSTVFEGDCPGGIFEGLCIGYCETCKQFQLIFDGLCSRCTGDFDWSEFVEDDGKIEIIGNRFQHPELLK